MARITVEDCLEKENNRFALVQLASKRTKQLLNGSKALTESDNKPVVTALREIAEGLVRFMTPEETERAQLEAEREAEERAKRQSEMASLVISPALPTLSAEDVEDDEDDDDDEEEELEDELLAADDDEDEVEDLDESEEEGESAEPTPESNENNGPKE